MESLLRIFQILLLVFATINSLSQTVKPSCYELRWAFFHPIAGLKVKKISRQIGPVYLAGKIAPALDSFANGGRSDAYRHVLYMAAFAQKIKVRKLRQLGRIHEKANYRNFLNAGTEEGERADSLSCEMDLYNNELGFEIGRSTHDPDPQALSLLVISALSEGRGRIMKRDARGNYLDCDGQTIVAEKYVGKWHVPKCLVASNYRYSD